MDLETFRMAAEYKLAYHRMLQERAVALSVSRQLWFYGSITLVLVTFSCFALYNFGHHFLLIEYRQQIEIPYLFNPLNIFAPSTLFNDAMSVSFSRAFFALTVGFFGTVCGHDLLCHNIFHIFLLVASALLFVAA